MNEKYTKLKEYMQKSKKTVVVTGAGISYLYGMRKLKETVGLGNARMIFSESYIRKNPKEFYNIIKSSFLDATFIKGPSKVHKQLAKLEKRGMIYGIITQNLDCLHTIAGSKNVVEFQGSFQDNICIGCEKHYNDYQIWNKGYMPTCEECGSIIMPTCFYKNKKESNSNMQKAIDMISSTDLVIIVGTSGFRSDEYLSKIKKDTKIVQINPSPTQFDNITDLNIRDDAEKVFDFILNGDEDSESF